MKWCTKQPNPKDLKILNYFFFFFWVKRFSTIPKYQVRLKVEALFFLNAFPFLFLICLKLTFFFFFFLKCLTGFSKFWGFYYNLFGQEIKSTFLWVQIRVFAQILEFWLRWLSLYLFLDFFGPKGNQLSPDMVWHIFIHIATCHVGWCDAGHAFLVKPWYIYIYTVNSNNKQ